MPIETGASPLARSEGAACLGEVVVRFADADGLIASNKTDPLECPLPSKAACQPLDLESSVTNP